MTLRLIVMGTPEFSVPTLADLLASGHDVAAVYSQPPRPAGRGLEPQKSAMHRFAEASGLPVLTPRSLRGDAEQAEFRAFAADVAVVVAYGLLLPQAILDATRLGCFNMHASALPRWRGAAPIQRALMAGDTATAAMVMRMEAGLDTGPICLAEHVAIGPDTTAGALHDELSRRGAGLIVRALAALERGSLAATPQSSDGVTYAAKIDKAETRIDFGRDANAVHDHIRSLSPAPGAWFDIETDGRRERIKVLRSTPVSIADNSAAPGTLLDDRLTVACSQGAVRLLELQRAGKKAMAAQEVLRGLTLTVGRRLNPPETAS
jgi:methionyl-tRNA formyltransferase